MAGRASLLTPKTELPLTTRVSRVCNKKCLSPTDNSVRMFVQPDGYVWCVLISLFLYMFVSFYTFSSDRMQIFGAFLADICARGLCLDTIKVPILLQRLIEEIKRRILCHDINLELFAEIFLHDVFIYMSALNRGDFVDLTSVSDASIGSLLKSIFYYLCDSLLPSSGTAYVLMMNFDPKHSNAVHFAARIFEHIPIMNTQTFIYTIEFLIEYKILVNKKLAHQKDTVTNELLVKSMTPCFVFRPTFDFPTIFVAYMIEKMQDRTSSLKQEMREASYRFLPQFKIIPRDTNMQLFTSCIHTTENKEYPW